MKYLVLLCMVVFTSQILVGRLVTNPELGNVNWLRDYQKAIDLSEKSGKPIFILFQEVPGCSTCKNFGHNIMEHSLIVEAIETYFVPLAIFNNKEGHDKEILDRFNEPAWNNPVCRVVNLKGKDIVSRGNGLYDLKSFVPYLNKAIFHSNQIVPPYLSLLESEVTAEIDEVVLQMYCFWTGEKELGDFDGVVYTEAAFSNGVEVVKVRFDRNKTSAKAIISQGQKCRVADAIHSSNPVNGEKKMNNYRIDKDLHYYLKNSKYAKLNLTKMQATKINSLLGKNKAVEHLLSPRQLKCVF